MTPKFPKRYSWDDNLHFVGQGKRFNKEEVEASHKFIASLLFHQNMDCYEPMSLNQENNF
jgi:hypothetical protein